MLALLVSLIPVLQGNAAVTNNSNLQKLPDSYQAGSGEFVLTEDCRFFISATSAPDQATKELAQFISQQFAAADLGLTESPIIVWGGEGFTQSGDIMLKIDFNAAGGKAEGYKLQVSNGKLSIIGADSRGLMYGAFMAIKMFRANGTNTLGGCTITDSPEAAERTVMLDCGRKYFTAEWIKNYIREMAYMGYNTFEFHFAEDQGFRLDIWDENYFESPNGNDFSWISGGMVGSWVNSAYQDYADKRKYLTAQEVVEILEVAKQYQVDVIPSFDTPMHCQYLRYKWPAYVYGDNDQNITCPTVNKNFSFNFDGNKYSKDGITNLSTNKLTEYGAYDCWEYIQVRDDDGNRKYTKTLDVTNSVSRALMEALLEDYADFFKQYGCDEFNICADEVAFYIADGWQGYARNVLSQKYTGTLAATLESTGSKYDTFVDYINEITDLLQNKGYTVRIFSDFVDRDGLGTNNTSREHWYTQNLTFDEDLEILYWWLPEDNSFVRNVTHFANSNYTIYNCVQNYTYYVLATNSSGADGRDPNTSYWTWQYASADRCYNNWNPTVFTHPTKGSTNVLSASKVSGGYFLIWTDYGAYNTETQVWNGIDSAGKYNIIERMWSNCYKMWTYDLNSKLTYANFDTLTTSFGHYPGYTSCTAKTTLPAVPLISPTGLSVSHKTMVGDTECIIEEELLSNQPGSWYTYTFYDRPGYSFIGVEDAVVTEEINYSPGCFFMRHKSGANGGTIHGILSGDCTEITIWYENIPDISSLENLVAIDLPESGFTAESWAAYIAAYEEAMALYNAAAGDPESATHQEALDACAGKLLQALAELECDTVGETKLHSFRLGSDVVSQGRFGVLFFETSADVSISDIKIMNGETEIPIATYGLAFTTDSSGETVKQWRIRFIAETPGECNCTLRVRELSEAFTFTCS